MCWRWVVAEEEVLPAGAWIDDSSREASCSESAASASDEGWAGEGCSSLLPEHLQQLGGWKGDRGWLEQLRGAEVVVAAAAGGWFASLVGRGD